MIEAYLTYAPLYDLLFQVMLMFGMVMASTGQVQEELEAVNADLKRARNRVEASAWLDPLPPPSTGAHSRRCWPIRTGPASD